MLESRVLAPGSSIAPGGLGKVSGIKETASRHLAPVRDIHEAYEADGDMICAGTTWYIWCGAST